MVAELGGSAISTCWGQINKHCIMSQRKPMGSGWTAWTHRLYLWTSGMFWRKRGWNELQSNHPPGQVPASLSRTEFFIFISLNFHLTLILDHLMASGMMERWKTVKTLCRRRVGFTGGFRLVGDSSACSKILRCCFRIQLKLMLRCLPSDFPQIKRNLIIVCLHFGPDEQDFKCNRAILSRD